MNCNLGNIQSAFKGMKEDAGWNTDSDLLYGHFFTDPNPEKLKPVAIALIDQGLAIVNIYPTDDGSTYFLHAEIVRTHSPDSLHEANVKFNELANELGIESYDGWDVGVAPT